MKYDHYETKIDYRALFLCIYLAAATIASVVGTYMYIKLDRRIDYVEYSNGPAMPTEWRIVNGKVSLYQSPYYVQVAP